MTRTDEALSAEREAGVDNDYYTDPLRVELTATWLDDGHASSEDRDPSQAARYRGAARTVRALQAEVERLREDAEKWRAVRTPNGSESGQRELAQFWKLLVKISDAERERDALAKAVTDARAKASYERQRADDLADETAVLRLALCRANSKTLTLAEHEIARRAGERQDPTPGQPGEIRQKWCSLNGNLPHKWIEGAWRCQICGEAPPAMEASAA